MTQRPLNQRALALCLLGCLFLLLHSTREISLGYSSALLSSKLFVCCIVCFIASQHTLNQLGLYLFICLYCFTAHAKSYLMLFVVPHFACPWRMRLQPWDYVNFVVYLRLKLARGDALTGVERHVWASLQSTHPTRWLPVSQVSRAASTSLSALVHALHV